MKRNSDFTIRRATESDLENLLELFKNTVLQVCRKDYGPDQIAVWVNSIHNKKNWSDKIRSQYFILAESEGEIMGFGSIEENGFLDFLYVHYLHQGKGIATLIYNRLLDYAKKIKVQTLYANVSITARPFFEKQGFKVVKEQRVKRGDVDLVNYRMENIF